MFIEFEVAIDVARDQGQRVTSLDGVAAARFAGASGSRSRCCVRRGGGCRGGGRSRRCAGHRGGDSDGANASFSFFGLCRIINQRAAFNRQIVTAGNGGIVIDNHRKGAGARGTETGDPFIVLTTEDAVASGNGNVACFVGAIDNLLQALCS